MRKFLSVTLFIIFASALIFPIDVGEQAPVFVNPDLSGQYVFSKNILGSGWVILDFFATDCVPCQEEIPELEALYEEFSDKGLQIIVFATDQGGASVVSPFFDKSPKPLTVLLDRYKVTAEKYGVDEIPSVFLIDADGKVVIKGVGYSEEIIQDMRNILAEPPTAE